MDIFSTLRKWTGKKISLGAEETPHRTKAKAPGPWQVGDWIRPDGGYAYEVRAIKGGGMGQVYICIREDDRTPFALKTFKEKYLASKAAIDRFKWEAEVWVRLGRHKNMVRAHRTDTSLGYTFVVLEYVVGDEHYGPDLSGWIRKGGLSIPLALDFACQFCSGMIHAKETFDKDPALKPPFVHRDIKPQNIMVTRDRTVKVTDFGLVKAFGELEGDIEAEVEDEFRERRHSFTKKGDVCGTFPYIAPEIWRGEEPDERTDIYSFGCVLYEMFYGLPPFVYSPYDPERYDKYRNAHLNLSPKLIKDIPEEINALILKCLKKERDERYQNFQVLREDLAELYYQRTKERLIFKEQTEAEWEASDWLEKGTGFLHLGFNKEAIASYHKALEINPRNAFAHNSLGIVYRNKGMLDEAIACCKKAIEINPRYADAHHNLGAALEDKGLLEEALREFRVAIRINPNSAEPYYGQASVLKKLGKLKEALDLWKRYLQLAEEVPSQKDWIPKAQEHIKDLEKKIAGNGTE